MNKNKKKILISWAPHLFKENIPPIINNINKEFDIYVIAVDYDTPKNFTNELEKMKKNNLIVNYYFIAEYPKLLSHFYDLNKLSAFKIAACLFFISFSSFFLLSWIIVFACFFVSSINFFQF